MMRILVDRFSPNARLHRDQAAKPDLAHGHGLGLSLSR
jgi:hypothetical protein